jgi:inosine/xanthosine triphosphatase
MKVIIASKNPVKINAVKAAFSEAFLDIDFEFKGIASDSGVPDQPIGEKQTFQGAKNRLDFIQNSEPKADYWVGIEGGINNDSDGSMEAFAWMIIRSESKEGKARTANFYLPKQISTLVNGGMELGHADDKIFGKSNSKQSSGSVGILTQYKLNRTEYYSHAILLALIPFLNPSLDF